MARKTTLIKNENKYCVVVVGAPVIKEISMPPKNYALNIWRKNYPMPSASVNSMPDSSMYQAIDGRTWYFPEITKQVDNRRINFAE
jgi:hypothetical protein